MSLDDVIYTKKDGTQTWSAVGRYGISGDAMVVYYAGGGKQLWER